MKTNKFNFWVWLCRFAYRRAKHSFTSHPVGLPGNRDPENECEYYAPRKRHINDAKAVCETDGHYLCKDCIWNINNNSREKRE
jgi:hypothetical protein